LDAEFIKKLKAKFGGLQGAGEPEVAKKGTKGKAGKPKKGTPSSPTVPTPTTKN